MKKVCAIFMTLILLMGTLSTAAMAASVTQAIQVDAIQLSNVISNKTLVDGIVVYACEEQTVVTITEDIFWLNLYYLTSDESVESIGFDATYSAYYLPAFDTTNMTVVLSKTNTSYTLENYLLAVSAGTISWDDPVYIAAGSSFEIEAMGNMFFLETIYLDGSENDVCVVYSSNFDGVSGDAEDADITQAIEAITDEAVEEVAEQTQAIFSDVEPGASYEAAIMWAVEAGVTSGYADGTFRPDATCTRGQVVTFLYRAMGSPAVTTTENPFADVAEESVFYDAILWAVENGITTGYADGTFRPGDTCTSAQVITFLYRAMGEPETDFESQLTASVADAFVPAITWADGSSLLEGLNFVPGDASPRCDIVTYLYLIANT